jgi:hypothetical protein
MLTRIADITSSFTMNVHFVEAYPLIYPLLSLNSLFLSLEFLFQNKFDFPLHHNPTLILSGISTLISWPIYLFTCAQSSCWVLFSTIVTPNLCSRFYWVFILRHLTLKCILSFHHNLNLTVVIPLFLPSDTLGALLFEVFLSLIVWLF